VTLRGLAHCPLTTQGPSAIHFMHPLAGRGIFLGMRGKPQSYWTAQTNQTTNSRARFSPVVQSGGIEPTQHV
jgi:hypothetical protein